MTTPAIKQLHWTQRITLVRHNLHAASRSGDFGFFKSLQAAGLLEGTNHFATLSATLGDEADALLAALDNLNGALSFMHQDAFQVVHDNLKNSMRDDDKQADRSKLYVDISMQKSKAEMAIDKLSNSAIALINQTPIHAQEQAANVYITGLTIIADCVEVVTKQFETLDQKIDDFIRLEDSFNTIKASVLAANAGLKGIFYMLDTHDQNNEDKAPRNLSISSAGSNLFRRMSTAFQSTPATDSRSSSVASAGATRAPVGGSMPVYRTPNYVRNSVSAGCPTSMPSNVNFDAFNKNSFMGHKLSMIPPTPATEDEGMDPFDTIGVPPVPEITAEQRQMSQAVM
ncbi:hypothetical protein CLAFUW4_10843 [Fulvia fulva]|uniref:Uncharacterized protein n=1 Tax=Passalora fulva TaxID=5499 RepID=A0A9Q8PD86_PASFU|nr:uncharacterized protein CLAFUR5_09886 [Fulvia fulva]KAK4619362.1 hypothetical protein CLAFUR4_10848 [Fulvia fulva]KAK4620317.1 hypothetical protein CLAFUR0_10855 [Fulvia fulva]UJO20300.1 hypothetical protein CLAFUR5_09886 [Fulvia fulva]WPV17628.1 hypothetical protein CLAFUW4_10843 [Fulvia fulva]WPV32307.1 hypothetical protein CLAFUW7_10841 [Fulvia fulva]